MGDDAVSDFRERAALAALAGVMASPRAEQPAEDVAKTCWDCAMALDRERIARQRAADSLVADRAPRYGEWTDLDEQVANMHLATKPDALLCDWVCVAHGMRDCSACSLRVDPSGRADDSFEITESGLVDKKDG